MNSGFWRNQLKLGAAPAAVAYFGVVALLATISWTAVGELYGRYVALAEATELLQRIGGLNDTRDADTAPSNESAFLEGESVTVAAAALQQRVTRAVTKVGGTVSSSQLELQGTRADPGFLTLTISCELDEPALQPLLYDLEAGNPFLFVDQLVVQTSKPGAAREGVNLRVVLAVSGQWQHPK
jgi:general secretion pathway protein M